MIRTHVIIGMSAAGISAANKIRQLAPDDRIICISAESELPYNKCHLADYLSGSKEENQIYILTQEKATQNNIELLFGARVMEIVSEKKHIVLDNDHQIVYDTLLIGSGSSPVIPPIAGINHYEGIFTFHMLSDAHNILSYVEQNQVEKAVIIGAGLSGLECADSLKAQGIEVTVVEMQSQVLPQQIDSACAAFIEKCMSDNNIKFCKEKSVAQICGDDNKKVSEVVLQNGEKIACQMVIVAAGSRPNTTFAQAAGITLYKGGILTNEFMQTNLAGIYAAGDVAAVKDQLTRELVLSCTWPDAMMQGMIAAQAMVDQPKPYAGVAIVTSSSFFGTKFVSAGIINNVPSTYQVIIKQEDTFYHKIVLNDGVVKGFCMVGNIASLCSLRRSLLTKTPLDNF